MEEGRKSAREIRLQAQEEKQKEKQKGIKKVAVTKRQKDTIYWISVMVLAVVLGSVGGILGVIAAVVLSNMLVRNFFE